MTADLEGVLWGFPSGLTCGSPKRRFASFNRDGGVLWAAWRAGPSDPIMRQTNLLADPDGSRIQPKSYLRVDVIVFPRG